MAVIGIVDRSTEELDGMSPSSGSFSHHVGFPHNKINNVQSEIQMSFYMVTTSNMIDYEHAHVLAIVSILSALEVRAWHRT